MTFQLPGQNLEIQIILVSSHLIRKLKIVMKILRSREDTHFYILIVSPLEILVTLQLPLGLIFGPGPRRNF
jgi:hypothetical protein